MTTDALPHLTPYLEFFVPGRVASAGSKKGHWNPKAVRPDGGLGKVTIQPDSKFTKSWMALVAGFAKDAMLRLNKTRILEGAILLWIAFYFERPKKHYRTGRHAGELKPNAEHFHTIMPDGVKCCRSTEDAMTGIVWRDDCLVAVHSLQKLYAEPDETPGASVKVYLLGK